MGSECSAQPETWRIEREMQMLREKKFSAVILAAGSGKRMGTSVAKQYLPLLGKPLMVYSLEIFDKSDVDEIVLVVSAGEEEYCRKNIVEKYGIRKVAHIIEGGQERYDSVYAGLQAVSGDYVLIHDSARAFVTGEIIRRAMDELLLYPAVVVGMPSKDTIKIADSDGFVALTPPREQAWMIQTPQCFSVSLAKGAYEKIMRQEHTDITDDAMVVERMTEKRIRLIEGSYENIKVTTPEDLALGESILKRREGHAFL